MKRRKNSISLMNAGLCLVVIFIHLLGMPVSESERGTLQFSIFAGLLRMSTFAVQGFIFLSGMKLFLKRRERRYVPYISGRFVRVFLPYAAAVAAYYLYFSVVTHYLKFSVSDYLGYLFRGDLAAHFYFIIVIMQFYLLYPVWRAMAQSVRASHAIIAAAVMLLLFVMAVHLSGVIETDEGGAFADRVFLKYIVYWVGGMYAGLHYKRFMIAMRDSRNFLGVIALIAAAADTGAYIASHYTAMSAMLLDALHTLYCLSMILLCCALAASRKRRIGAHMARIDASSYFIYLVHVLLIFILDNCAGNMGIDSVPLLFAARSAIIYAAVFCISEVKALLRR